MFVLHRICSGYVDYDSEPMNLDLWALAVILLSATVILSGSSSSLPGSLLVGCVTAAITWVLAGIGIVLCDHLGESTTPLGNLILACIVGCVVGFGVGLLTFLLATITRGLQGH